MPSSHLCRCSADKGSPGVKFGRILLRIEGGHYFVLMVHWAFYSLKLWRRAQTRWPTCLFCCRGVGEGQVQRHLLQIPGPLDSTGLQAGSLIYVSKDRCSLLVSPLWITHRNTGLKAPHQLPHLAGGEGSYSLSKWGMQPYIHSFRPPHRSSMKCNALFKSSLSALNT